MGYWGCWLLSSKTCTEKSQKRIRYIPVSTQTALVTRTRAHQTGWEVQLLEVGIESIDINRSGSRCLKKGFLRVVLNWFSVELKYSGVFKESVPFTTWPHVVPQLADFSFSNILAQAKVKNSFLDLYHTESLHPSLSSKRIYVGKWGFGLM